MTLILCGPPFSGKSTIAQHIATKWQYPLIDTDDLIEKRIGMSISDLYLQVGEEEFRKIEQDIIDSLSPSNRAVLALGGGITSPTLDGFGPFFYLRVPVEVLWQRLEHSERRPAYLGLQSPFETFSERIAKRLPAYEELADYVIDGNRSIGEIVEEIGELYGL